MPKSREFVRCLKVEVAVRRHSFAMKAVNGPTVQ
jgi:hypothetical protein